MKLITGHKKDYFGPIDGHEKDVVIFQPGINRVTTDGQLGIAFIDNGEVTDMFSLDRGTHRVKFPGNGVIAVVECDPDTHWFVKSGGVFNPADPTRVDAALIRPKSQREEMQDYMNDLAARAMARSEQDMLRSGQAEFDPTEDDYSEDLEEDGTAPLSLSQLGLIMKELELDIKASRKQSDIEEEAPPVALKTPPSGPTEQPVVAPPPAK